MWKRFRPLPLFLPTKILLYEYYKYRMLRCVAAASPRKWVSAADVKPVAIKKQTRRSVSLVLCFLYFFLAFREIQNRIFEEVMLLLNNIYRFALSIPKKSNFHFLSYFLYQRSEFNTVSVAPAHTLILPFLQRFAFSQGAFALRASAFSALSSFSIPSFYVFLLLFLLPKARKEKTVC